MEYKGGMDFYDFCKSISVKPSYYFVRNKVDRKFLLVNKSVRSKNNKFTRMVIRGCSLGEIANAVGIHKQTVKNKIIDNLLYAKWSKSRSHYKNIKSDHKDSGYIGDLTQLINTIHNIFISKTNKFELFAYQYKRSTKSKLPIENVIEVYRRYFENEKITYVQMINGEINYPAQVQKILKFKALPSKIRSSYNKKKLSEYDHLVLVLAHKSNFCFKDIEFFTGVKSYHFVNRRKNYGGRELHSLYKQAHFSFRAAYNHKMNGEFVRKGLVPIIDLHWNLIKKEIESNLILFDVKKDFF